MSLIKVRKEGEYRVEQAINHIIEWQFSLSCSHAESLVAHITTQNKSIELPLFALGKDRWAFRFSAPSAGVYDFCVMQDGKLIDSPQGVMVFTPYQGHNELLKKGPIAVKHHSIVHTDGTPFLWLSDAWWHGMTKRLPFEDFQTLVDDRTQKGFSAIQFAIGFGCDQYLLDERDANEAGYPWTEDLEAINPDYFEYVDQKIAYLVDQGIVPCIVGAWGYYMRWLGVEKFKLHWRNIIARYGAFPVVYIVCGESRLNWYLDTEEKALAVQKQVDAWSEVTAYIKQIDPFQRILTIHPGPKVMVDGEDAEQPPLYNMDITDLVLLQPGHSDYDAVAQTVADYGVASKQYKQPIMVGECCFEGMHGGAGPKSQRQLFWASILSGMPGYSYGNDSMWQMNSKKELFGKSPLGHIWGNTPWEESISWAGATHLGFSRKFLLAYPWEQLQPAMSDISSAWSPDNLHGAFCAKAGNDLVFVYFPIHYAPWGKKVIISQLSPSTTYGAAYFNPVLGIREDLSTLQTDREGSLEIPYAPVLQDYVFVLERR